jgi:hypothetical protein
MANPCWKGYVQVGEKTLKGKQVPNCVPEGSGKSKVSKPAKKTAKKTAGYR